MADWYVRFRTAAPPHNVVGEFSVLAPTASVKNSAPGDAAWEMPLGMKRRTSTTLGITKDMFAPKRTWYELWRQSTGSGVCVSDGFLDSVNLNKDRDSIMCAGKDWKSYLDERIYPFYAEAYKEFDEEQPEAYWDRWPKKWFLPGDDFDEDEFLGTVPMRRIIRDLLLSMRTGRPIDRRGPASAIAADDALGSFPIRWALSLTGGPVAKYKIYPGDQTTILGHINALAEMNDGFEWDIEPISYMFRMWQPKRFPSNVPVYHFVPSDDEADGAVIDFDWTNEGPDGTFLFGYGAAEHKMGAIWSYDPALEQFGRYDLVYDYGTVASYNVILKKLKDQNDLWPQKKLSFSLLNPEFLGTNFYTGGRPRDLIGNTVRVTKAFPPYHTVDAYFQINAINWRVDESTNEIVELELMMIYEPETGASGGLPSG